MNKLDCITEKKMKLLHTLSEYREWIDEHYCLDIFSEADGEALLAELQPEEFPCVALFIKEDDSYGYIPVFIPVSLFSQGLIG